jgi:hypothetical protein
MSMVCHAQMHTNCITTILKINQLLFSHNFELCWELTSGFLCVHFGCSLRIFGGVLSAYGALLCAFCCVFFGCVAGVTEAPYWSGIPPVKAVLWWAHHEQLHRLTQFFGIVEHMPSLFPHLSLSTSAAVPRDLLHQTRLPSISLPRSAIYIVSEIPLVAGRRVYRASCLPWRHPASSRRTRAPAATTR